MNVLLSNSFLIRNWDKNALCIFLLLFCWPLDFWIPQDKKNKGKRQMFQTQRCTLVGNRQK